MTIVVTGAGGFVGQQLVRRLVEAGETVTAVDLASAGIPTGSRVVTGDLVDASVIEAALAGGCRAIVHLATVPGGAAEANPALSRRINVDAMYDLMLAASRKVPAVRLVYASSIAVLGQMDPAGMVDDDTPLSPHMVYGGHKAMMEPVVAMLANREAIDGVTVRLPGIVARSEQPSGLKSAFLSNLFHALRRGAPITVPMSRGATMWLQSVDCCAANLIRALSLDTRRLPVSRAVTLPALRVTLGSLVDEVARQCGRSPDLVAYQPDAALEATFGRSPLLHTPAADRAGFSHDGTLFALVASALATLASPA